MKGGVPCTTTRSALSPALPALERFPERRKSGRSEGEGERMRRRAPCATRTTFAQRMAGWSEARSAEFRSAALRTFGGKWVKQATTANASHSKIACWASPLYAAHPNLRIKSPTSQYLKLRCHQTRDVEHPVCVSPL